MKTIVIIICLFILAGCYTEKKATNQHGRAVATFPEIGADYCARTYPPQPSIDSVFTSDSSKFKETIEGLQGDLYSASALTDSLINALANGDTTCRKYAQVIIELQKQIIALKQKVITLPPVTTHTEKTNTIVNTAEVDLWRIEVRRAIGLLEKKTAEYDKMKKARDKWRLIAIGLMVVLGLGLFFKIRKMFAKK